MDEYQEAVKEFFKVYNGIKKIYLLSLAINFKGDEETKYSINITRQQGKEIKTIIRVKENSDTEAFRRAKAELLRYYKVNTGG